MSRQKIHPMQGSGDFFYQREERQWFANNVSKRVCTTFFQYKNETDVCECGFEKVHHTNVEANSGGQAKKWVNEEHTTALPTDAFGEIDFDGNKESTSKFVRVDYQTDVRLTLTLLMEVWKLHPPHLLISVTGGAKNLHLSPVLKQTFKSGLMRAAASTGAWIITAGTSSGVVKLVGEAAFDHVLANGVKNRNVVLGIAAWGLLANKSSLVCEPQRNQDGYTAGVYPADYRLGNNTKFHRREYPLDPNHTHFILVDDGTQHRYSPAENNFRTALEDGISNYNKQMGDAAAMQIPLVHVVLEGGPGTIDTVYSALRYRTPVLIVAGSGRAADILAHAYHYSSEEEMTVNDAQGRLQKRVVVNFDDKLDSSLKEMVDQEFGKRNTAQVMETIKLCLQYRQYLSIFRMDHGGQDLDLAILKALLSVNKHNGEQQLKLALALNRIDLARADIFTDNKLWTHEELQDTLFQALIDDKVEFVELILEKSMESGIDLKRFLTIERLYKLYNMIPANSLLHFLLRKFSEEKEVSATNRKYTLRDVGILLKYLMGSFYQPLYLSMDRYNDLVAVPTDVYHKLQEGNDENNVKLKDVLERSYKSNTLGISQKHKTSRKSSLNPILQAVDVAEVNAAPPKIEEEKKKTQSDFEEPVRELFIWSVLLHRQALATSFWRNGRLGIAGAVVAQRLLASMQPFTDDADIRGEIKQMLQKFETLAVGVLSQCHISDEGRAPLLLVRELPNYGYSTVMQLAAETSVNFNFITHVTVQALIKNIWMGRISHDTRVTKIVLSVFFPPLIWLLIKFREDDWRSLVTVPKRTFNENDDEEEVHLVPKQMLSQKSLKSLEFNEPFEIQERKSTNNRCSMVFTRFYHFFAAPIVVFILNFMSSVAFILLFSHVLVINFTSTISSAEIVLYIWVFSLCAEEIRQFSQDSRLFKGFFSKLTKYISDLWNVLDMICLTTFLIGVILRVIPDCDRCFQGGRITLAIDLMFFYVRLLHSLSIHRELGPKLVMIGKMMWDLLSFIVILLVFVMGYGTALQAILYPNSEFNLWLINDIISKAYFQIYGELFLEELEGELSCTNDPLLYNNRTMPRCPDNNWFTPILLGIYILFTNVLMLNMLIAMFNNTFTNVQEKTDLHWYFQRYFLIKEYTRRPMLPPPFILFTHIFRIVKSCAYNCCYKEEDFSDDDFKMKLTPVESQMLSLWERINASEYTRKMQGERKHVQEKEAKDRKMFERIEVIEQNISKQNEQMEHVVESLNWMMGVLKKQTGEVRLDTPSDKHSLRVESVISLSREPSLTMPDADSCHVQARIHRYPSPTERIFRLAVPDSKVDWSKPWTDYSPKMFTERKILKKSPPLADPDLTQLPDESRGNAIKFNVKEDEFGTKRFSFEGTIEIVEGFPRNPKGRTGLMGRGTLWRWGPNHCVDCIVTRWSRDSDGDYIREKGKKVLEFVAVRREDNQRWAVPGGIWKEGMDMMEVMKTTFLKKTMPGMENDEDIRSRIDNLFEQHGQQVYAGYSDDPRNTDNTWLETTAWNFHDEDGDLVDAFPFKAGFRVEFVCWMKISNHRSLHAGHLSLLQSTAKLLEAAF